MSFRTCSEKVGRAYRANAFDIPFIATYAPSLWVSIGSFSRMLDRRVGRERERVDGCGWRGRTAPVETAATAERPNPAAIVSWP